MFAVLLVVNIKPFIGDGPWAFKLRETACTKYWWTNLLYVNNFHPGTGNGPSEVCITRTYLLFSEIHSVIPYLLAYNMTTNVMRHVQYLTISRRRRGDYKPKSP